MSAVPVGLPGLAAVIGTRVPGSPGGVRSLAASWRRSGDTVGEGASLMSSAASSAPSWQGVSAQAFAAAASSLSGELSGRAGELGRGAGVMDAYAGVLERAHGMAAELQAQAARLLVTSIASPAAALACQVAATVVTTTFNTLLSTVDLAAATAAASLGTTASANSRNGNGEPSKGKGDTPSFSEEDKKRLREQADGKGDWDPDANQGIFGDCYLLATLQGYSRTEEGQQFLRDQVRWDDAKNAFVVTLYKDGKPIYITVDDYYSEGTKDDQGRPTLMSIYERAYGKRFGFEELDNGGSPEEAMHQIQYGKNRTQDTWGTPTWIGIPLPREDHKYDKNEWNDIEQSVKDGKPVVAYTTNGDFSNGETVDAATDTNDDGKIDTENKGSNGGPEDETGKHKIVGHHSYTVVGIDDKYVTLRNPWGKNDTSNGYNHPLSDKDDGLIRVSREDYEKYFANTTIAEDPW